MTLRERQETFTQNVAKLIQYIFENGRTCTLGEAFRTKEQAELYYKQGKGSATSLHCQRLAIDLNIFKDGVYLSKTSDYAFAGDYWYSLNPENRWGGAGNDGNHFSMSNVEGKW